MRKIVSRGIRTSLAFDDVGNASENFRVEGSPPKNVGR